MDVCAVVVTHQTWRRDAPLPVDKGSHVFRSCA